MGHPVTGSPHLPLTLSPIAQQTNTIREVLTMRHAAIIVALLSLIACTGDNAADVTLAQLAAQQDDYAGRQVVVSGTLRSHPDPLHYWIEDDAYHRVELDFPGDLTGREGEPLTVRGRFRYQPDRGRSIKVVSLE
ncbi:hypothetical protein [Chromatocurvus halotolerans]|nr:hypothetical protein [Chromatocurvus halotolerans]